MMKCPKCGRPVSGRARVCGYCGESLVRDYFRQPDEGLKHPALSAGSVAADLLGALGSLSLLGALVTQLLALYGIGAKELMPTPDLAWWTRALVLALPPLVYLIQMVSLRGRRSVVSDSGWLFVGVCGLTVTLQAYLSLGTDGFYGIILLPCLLVVGSALIAISAATGILAYR